MCSKIACHHLSAHAQPTPPRKPLRHRLIGSQAFRTKHGAINVAVHFLGLIAVLPRLRHAQFEFPDRRREFRVFFELTLLLRGLLLFADWTLARRGDLTRGWQSGFGKALFLGQVFVFDEGFVVILSELFAEVVLDDADVVGQGVCADRVVGRGCGE